MPTGPSLRLSVALLLLFATTVLAADDEKDNTDFLLNVFSDIGPILALFGEQFARQFLSETFTWEDHIIFVCIPLGIITAISGAIRVQGGGLFKAVIGRARENHAAAEIEYMSSTSTEVCELYNGEGIVRTMGKPYIGQIVICPDQFPNGDSCGIHTLETAKKDQIMEYKGISRRGRTKVDLTDNFSIDYQLESPPRLFKWFGPSSTPTNVKKNQTKPEMNQQRDLESCPTEEQGIEDSDRNVTRQVISTGPEIPQQQRSKNSGRQELHQGTLSNGRSPPSRHDTSRTLMRKGHKSEKKNPWLTLKSPNLQLNIPCKDVSEKKHHYHLVLAAIVALALQVALLAIAVSTVYFISGFDPEPWGLPCYLGGSILLFFGMLACSVAIEKRTRELTWYRPSVGEDPKEFHLLWIQRNQRVSEQDFGSLVIDGGTRRHIMTSSREEDLEGLEHHEQALYESATEKTATTEEIETSHTSSTEQEDGDKHTKFSFLLLLPLIAVLFGGTGFTVQFIGLRGLPWPCAISHLGAMIIMAIIRALIRRRLTKTLKYHYVLEKHELDYLAIQLVEKSGRVFDRGPKRNTDAAQWDIIATVRSTLNKMFRSKQNRNQRLSTEVLVWKVDTASDVVFEPKKELGAEAIDTEIQLVFKPCRNTLGTTSDPLPSNHSFGTAYTGGGQQAILVRKRLGDLCKWPNNTSKSALALTLSIERFMKEFFPEGLPTDDPTKVTLKIPFSRSHTSDQDPSRHCSDQTAVSWIEIDIERTSDAMAWTVDNGQVEAILSLWMAHWTAGRVDHLESDGKEVGSKGQSTDWRRAGDGSHVEYCRRIGENRNGVLRRDISWWVNNAVEGLQAEDSREIKGSHDNASSGSKDLRFSFGFNSRKGTPVSSAKSVRSKISISSTISATSKPPSSFGSSNSSKSSGGSELSDSSEVSDSTGSSEFLVQHSTADLVTVMAQHLFTCFIWNIGNLLPKNLLNRGDININEFVKVESSRLFDLPSSIRAKSGRKLSHRKLTKFVNYAEKQGLGTPDDILLCIIPTFSFFDCLPNNVVLDYDQLVAKPFGSFTEEEQRKTCNHHMNLLDCIGEKDGMDQDEYLSTAIVVNTMEFVYLTALHIAKAKVCKTTKKTHPGEFVMLLEKLLGDFSDCLRSISPIYELQRRRETLEGLLDNLEIDREKTEAWYSIWEKQEQDESFMRKIGFTDCHRQVVELKPVRKLNLQTLLVVLKNGSARDIFGWTPLHYAAARPELKFKPEKAITQPRPKDNRLEITLNDNIRTKRWVDKFRRSPVHIAAAAGNINLLEILLPYLHNDARLAICKGGIDEMSPLHLAAQGNHKNCKIDANPDDSQQGAEGNRKKCIITLLENKPQTQNDTDAWKQSPIHTALTLQCYACTRILLGSESLDFRPEIPDYFKRTLLSYLGEDTDDHRHIGKELLLNHYKKFDIRKTGGDNILHYAIKFMEYRFDLRSLVQSLKDSVVPPQSDISVDVTNSRGQTPLHLAVLTGKTRLAVYLVMAGASPSLQDKNQTSAMILACQQGDVYSAAFFLQRDDTYRGTETDAKGKTALHYAVSSSKWPDESLCLAIVQRLADVMKSINVCDHEDKTPLQSAVEANRKSVCLDLLRRKASIKLLDVSKLRALNGIVQSDLEMEPTLRAEWESQIRTETKARVDEKDMHGNTALHRAVDKGDDDTVDWLVQNEANLQTKNNSGRTAFIEACRQDKCHRFIKHVVNALNSEVLKDFNINKGDSVRDEPALSWACESGHEEVVKALLAADMIDLRQQATRYYQYTPLHFALDGKKAGIVSLLLDGLEKDDLLSKVDAHGLAPIQFAIKTPDQGCLYQLVMHPKGGPSLFSCDELVVVLKVCSGKNIQVNEGVQFAWDEKAAEGFLDADNWTLADIAGKYGHPNLESYLRNKDKSAERKLPRRPYTFLGQYNGLTLTDPTSTVDGRTTNTELSNKASDLTYWVQKSRNFERYFYLRTKQPIPPDAQCYFFEVKILHLPQNNVFMLGFCGPDVPGGMLPGWNEGSWAYHADDGGLYEGDDSAVITNYDHICVKEDVMGCGVDFNTGEGYRMRNGQRLNSEGAFNNHWLKTGKLYPCVGFRDDGDGDKLQVRISLPGFKGNSFKVSKPESE
ncbi:unnamed protein product [Fusarium graminearum]|nr:unnamed protein product [Fusarium graminearum]